MARTVTAACGLLCAACAGSVRSGWRKSVAKGFFAVTRQRIKILLQRRGRCSLIPALGDFAESLGKSLEPLRDLVGQLAAPIGLPV